MKSLQETIEGVTATHAAGWCGRSRLQTTEITSQQSIPAVTFKLADHEMSGNCKYAKTCLVCQNDVAFVKIGHDNREQPQRVLNRKLQTSLSTFSHTTAESTMEKFGMVAEYQRVQVVLLTVKYDTNVGELPTCVESCKAGSKTARIAGRAFVRIFQDRGGLVLRHALMPVHDVNAEGRSEEFCHKSGQTEQVPLKMHKLVRSGTCRPHPDRQQSCSAQDWHKAHPEGRHDLLSASGKFDAKSLTVQAYINFGCTTGPGA